MKPEELDRLFRDELEKLNHVPGLDWNDEGAWTKLNKYLKGGWNNLWTWTLSSIAVIIGSYLLYTIYTTDTSSEQKQEKASVKTVVVQSDSISSVKETKNMVDSKNRFKVKRQAASSIPADTISINSIDTMPVSKEADTFDLKSATALKRNTLMKRPQAKQEFLFQMPSMSLFRLQVNNSFNVSNLVKSIQAEKSAGQNFYYFYEYHKNFVPPAYWNSHQRFTIDNTDIITNFNK